MMGEIRGEVEGATYCCYDKKDTRDDDLREDHHWAMCITHESASRIRVGM